jgi:hypothetical protein
MTLGPRAARTATTATATATATAGPAASSKAEAASAPAPSSKAATARPAAPPALGDELWVDKHKPMRMVRSAERVSWRVSRVGTPESCA